MTAIEERLALLEVEYDQLKPSLQQRLERLEKKSEEPTRKGIARLVAWMGPALPQLIGSVVILILAFLIKDSVDFAIKQQQLQLSFVKEMKEQLEAMANKSATLADIERAAVLVAAFGQPAVMPLMNELRYGGNRAIGAEAGLRSLAFMNQEAVCDIIPRVIASPTRLLDWEGLMVSARVIAAGNCRSALPTLQMHEQVLIEAQQDKIEGLSKVVEIMPVKRQQKLWLETLRDAIKVLTSDEK